MVRLPQAHTPKWAWGHSSSAFGCWKAGDLSFSHHQKKWGKEVNKLHYDCYAILRISYYYPLIYQIKIKYQLNIWYSRHLPLPETNIAPNRPSPKRKFHLNQPIKFAWVNSLFVSEEGYYIHGTTCWATATFNPLPDRKAWNPDGFIGSLIHGLWNNPYMN